MKKSIVIFVSLLFPCIAVFASQSPIFRTVDLNAGRSITLGEEFSKVEDLFVKVGSGYKLKPGTFAGTKSITVYLTRANRIKSIHFEYEPGVNLNTYLGSYTRMLGKPSGRSVLDASSMQVELIFWEDEKTKFELMRKMEREETSVSSALFDKSAK